MGSLMDSLSILKYLIVIELVLLFLPSYFGGRIGAALTVFGSTLLVTWFFVYMVGMSAAYSNGSSSTSLNFAVIMEIIVVGVVFGFLAVGMVWFVESIKFKKELGVLFYSWLAIVVGALIAISFVRYQYDPIRLMEVKMERDIKARNIERKKQKELKERINTDLKLQFENTMNRLKDFKGYIELSEQISLEHKDAYSLATHLANYTTKLMIRSMQQKDYEVTRALFDSYVNSIVPHTGISDKSADVASNAIVLGILSKNETVFSQVEKHILGVNFDLEQLDNEMLLFNLACHYSLKRNKPKMLLAIKQARLRGKPSESFLNDLDFEYYKSDKEFLEATQ